MSHDIRTPMNAIIGMTDLAVANRDNPEQIDESLSIIKNSSEHLLRLINDILDMSRIESGRMVLAKEVFNVKNEMDKLAVRFRALAEKERVGLYIRFGSPSRRLYRRFASFDQDSGKSSGQCH